MDGFIPVEAYVDGKSVIWYMDISTLSINELINLKEELKGSKTDSISAINSIIHQTIGYNIDDLKMTKRQQKKENRVYKNRNAFVKSKKRKGR